jgi:hypothetical protein
MLYHTNNIAELMPDVVAEEFEEKMHSPYKNRMGYFARNDNSLKNDMHLEESCKDLEIKEVSESMEGAKGNLPEDLLMFPAMCYNYRGSQVTLTGLNNSFG